MCYLAALAAEDPVVFPTGLVSADAALVLSPGQRVRGRVGFRRGRAGLTSSSSPALETHEGGGGRGLDHQARAVHCRQQGGVRLHLQGTLWAVEGVGGVHHVPVHHGHVVTEVHRPHLDCH